MIQEGRLWDLLLAPGVLNKRLDSLGHSLLSQFPWQQQEHSSLDLLGSDGRGLVLIHQAGCLPSNVLIDERVHNAHCLRRNAGLV